MTPTATLLALASMFAFALAGQATAADGIKASSTDWPGKANAPLGSPDYHPSAERPVGWRGDGTGRFPAANPPLEWYRQPRGGFMAIRALGAKPKGSGPEGQPLNMGMIREWLIAGPFEAKDHGSALQDVSLANETGIQPVPGQSLGGKPWILTPVSVAKQTGGNGHLVVDLAMAFDQSSHQGSQNHPGTIPAMVAYASTYLFAPEAVQLRIFIQGQKITGWLNGAEVKIPGQWEAPPVVALKAGWNVLTLKAASSKEIWNMSATLFPTANAGYETKNIQWMAPMPGPSWSSPIVVGSKIFVSADGGTLVCLNKADGQVLWTRSQTFYDAVSDEERAKFPELKAKDQELEKMMLELPDKLNSGLSIDGSKADQNQPMKEAIKRKSELEHAIQGAMAKADHKSYECWDNDRGTSTPTPTSDGKHVYAAFWGGNKGLGANLVCCYDLEGKRMWSSFTGQTGIGEHGTHTSPALSGNFVVYLSGSTLLAYDKATGKLAWSKKEETFGGASVVPLKIGGGDAVLVPQLGIFRTADGTEIYRIWKTDLQTDKPTPVVVDGTVYGLSDRDIYYSYEIGDGHPQGMVQKPWKDIGLQLGGIYNDLVMGAPLFDHGMVYIISEGCGLSVVEGRTGKPVFTKALESLNPRLTWVYTVGACTGPNLAGKVIQLRDDQSQTIVIATGPQYKELAKNVLWELQPDGKQQEAQSNPYYEGGRMYYRTQGFLYCIGEK